MCHQRKKINFNSSKEMWKWNPPGDAILPRRALAEYSLCVAGTWRAAQSGCGAQRQQLSDTAGERGGGLATDRRMHTANDSGSEARASPTTQTTQKVTVTIFSFLSCPIKQNFNTSPYCPKLHEGLFSVLPGTDTGSATLGARA